MRGQTTLLAAAVIALAGLSVPAHGATVTLSSFGSSSYSQNFDSLATTGTTNPIADVTGTGTGQLGWFVQSGTSLTTYIADAGTSGTGGIHSHGSVSNSDRALGSVATDTTSTIYYGFDVAVGPASTALQSVSFQYTGEQWRNGNSNSNIESLVFSYSTDATSLTSGTWTPVSALQFNSPIHTGSGTSLNGNSPANSASLSATLSSLNLAAGQTIYFRWADANNTGTDHALAIDNVRAEATFASAPVPLPAAVTAGPALLIGLAALRSARTRRSAGQ